MSSFQEDKDETDVQDYRSLASEEPSPPGFEERVFAELRSRGLFGNQRSKHFLDWKTIAAVAACLIFFTGGMFFEKYRSVRNETSVTMSEKTFLLLLVEDQHYQMARTASEEQERINLYRNWAIRLREKGMILDGTKLQPQSRLLSPGRDQEASHTEVAGYFLIDAGDLQQALDIARTCPHLQFGGRIEVRQIQPV